MFLRRVFTSETAVAKVGSSMMEAIILLYVGHQSSHTWCSCHMQECSETNTKKGDQSSELDVAYRLQDTQITSIRQKLEGFSGNGLQYSVHAWFHRDLFTGPQTWSQFMPKLLGNRSCLPV